MLGHELCDAVKYMVILRHCLLRPVGQLSRSIANAVIF